MTQEDIIRMACEAYGETDFHESALFHLTQFAALVAAAEREACAKVCEDMSGPIEIYNPQYVHYIGCASAIRARGQA